MRLHRNQGREACDRRRCPEDGVWAQACLLSPAEADTRRAWGGPGGGLPSGSALARRLSSGNKFSASQPCREAGLCPRASRRSAERGLPGSPGRALVWSQHFANMAKVKYFDCDHQDCSLFLLPLSLSSSSLGDATAASGVSGRVLRRGRWGYISAGMSNF